MASIDQYKHRLLGFISCPSDFDFVYNSPTRDIAIYELLQDIPDDEKDFDGKIGDIIVGGGSGEAPALRISIPGSVDFFIRDKDEDFENQDELFKTFWTPTESYMLCDGFKKLGWDTKTPIEFWLAENICRTIINETSEFKRFYSGQRLSTPLQWRL
jgi:hypothetical protein